MGRITPARFWKFPTIRNKLAPSPSPSRPYQAGRSKHWIKVKDREHPAKPGDGRARVARE